MSYVEKAQLSNELKTAFESFKEIHGELRGEIKKLGENTTETRTKLNRVHDRLDEIETRFSRPQVASNHNLEETEYCKAFKKFVTKGDEVELKISMNETIDPEGGYLVPPEWANYIIESLVQYSPIRRYANVMRVSSKEFKIPVQQKSQNLKTGVADTGLFRAGWTADLGPVAQTDTGQVKLVSIPTNDMYALPFVTQDMLDDCMFNVEAFVQQNLAKSMGHLEGTAFVSGNGVGQPFGLMTDTSLYSSVTSSGGVQYSIAADPDLLIDMYYELPDYYARNGTWLMNRQTIRGVREFTDGNGQYLWAPANLPTTGFGQDAPSTILGRPYAECIDMVAPASIDNNNNIVYTIGAQPILFGDIRSAYVITDRVGIRMLRDPYSSKPFVLFYTTARVGGQVVLPEALCVMKVQPAP